MSELNKVEKYFEDNLVKILENGHKDKDVRPSYDNGEEATSTFITQIVEEYDISKGELPITETRYIGWKSAINELLAIYQTQTNTQEGFERHNVNWWNPWMNSEGNIGKAYSYNLESHHPYEVNKDVVKVKKVKIDTVYGELKEVPLQNEIYNSINGNIYENHDNPFIIIDNRYEKTANGTYTYKIQFLKTGYIKVIRGNDLNQSIKKNRKIKDNFERSYSKIGYLGNNSSVSMTEEERKILTQKWESLIRRCYGHEHDESSYGKKGVFVHQEWHCLETFLKDIKAVPQYHLAKEDNFKGWDLDKDYYGSNCYSKYTCVFLKENENALYATMKPLLVTDKITNKQKIYINIRDCANDLGFSYGGLKTALHRTERLRRGTYSKYNFQYLNVENDDCVYRYELSRNQINELLRELLHNKFSRRHMTSFFNWSNHNKKMLVECAYETLWTVYEKNEDTYLDLTSIMRSSDVLTANHINKMQYVALMMMVAKHCGYKCGKFVHFVQNYHVYNTHMTNLNIVLDRLQQLKLREVQSQPKLILNVPSGTNFYDIKAEDFELVNYNPIKPQLKFDLAI